MEIKVSLFGKKEDSIGWKELFEQEKVPFQYRGENFEDFSLINILVGKTVKKIFKERNKIFIFEPSLKLGEDPLLSSNRFVLRKKNILKISSHISSRVVFCPVDRNKTLRVLRDILIKAFNAANFPYIHIWYYPKNYPSIFLFRQDIDYVDQKGLENLLQITKKFHIKGTYFINISGEEEFDEKLGPLNLSKPTTPERKKILQRLLFEGNEIGNHGYWHWVFKDFKHNYQNIKRCSCYLKKLFSIIDRGFAAPGAEWNFNLAKAIEKNRHIVYACNGLTNGGFPYYPYCNGRRTKVLEIPCSFFSDASQYISLSDSEINFPKYEKELRNLYLSLIDQAIKNNEPIAILGHPSVVGRAAKKFFYPIFKKIKMLKIPSYTFYEFANWWKQREKIRISYKKVGDQLIIKANRYPVLVETIYGKKKSIIIINKRSIINLKK
jgi:peptidoglycan/xylan/chitin deacetylase (PgdA/CDA1 family)